jgi:hypothetical protein
MRLFCVLEYCFDSDKLFDSGWGDAVESLGHVCAYVQGM